jgi:large subunit ribosomal protein L6
MSRIGKMPIPLPAGVTVTINGQNVVVKGPKGELALTVVEPIKVVLEDNAVIVSQ